ncbi:hypothetical protein [Kitasatospora kifunensis]|uniref:Uncharacterized protein n=1 Tax=Kitasatospora kifunensis TaxID=58351 RepID=A0A7W7VYI4_KITKI|nr:hypothetical protein [Kitasatospora kifunensis]MBB4926685.1 hypothetical protein [Kitasatospora kifunensis]
MDDSLPPLRRPVEPPAPESQAAAGLSDSLDASPFPLPQRHRRYLACAAVAASVALGTLGVGATVETVQHHTAVTASAQSH